MIQFPSLLTQKDLQAPEMAISLGSGTPFLGKFAVPEVTRTLIISGESGGAVLKDTARRICAAKGIDLEGLAVNWSFDLPELASPLHLRALGEAIRRAGVKVVFIDPVYLALLSGAHGAKKEAASIFDMGPLFRSVDKAAREAGATPVLLHHANRRIERGKPMELSDLAFAGLPEFAAQWFLLNRREPFLGDGLHKLTLNVGGRSGQGGLFNVDINEGQMDEDFRGRRFEVSVERATQAWADERTEKDQRKKDGLARQNQEEEESFLRGIGSLLRDNDEMRRLGWVGQRKLRDRVQMSKEKFGKTLSRLVESGKVEETAEAEFSWNPGKKSAAVRVRRGQTDFFADGLPEVA
jgi:replicative DNA helicase